MRLSFLIAVILAFVAGIGLRTLVEVDLAVVVWLLVVSLGLGLLWRRSEASSPQQLLLSLCFLFFALGIVRLEIAFWQFGQSELGDRLGEKVEVVGIISKEPDYREQSVQLFVQTDTDLVLVTADRQHDLSYGDEVMVYGQLSKPESFETDLGRTFNYEGYLKAKGVEFKMSFAEVEVLSSGKGNWFVSGLLSAKGNFINSLEKLVPEPQVGLGEGLLLGVKSALGEDIENDFRRSGIIHIVVLSGYNVMLVVSFMLLILSFFLSARKRVLAGIISIIAFALIVGLSATVVRASIMASLLLLAGVLGRRYDVLRSLLLAGVAMLVFNPYLLLFDIGFQLSFMATLGLVLIVPHFEATALNAPKAFGIKDFFLSTIATQVAVMPLLLFHIGEISLVSVIVNVLVLPIVPLAMLLTFLAGVIGLLMVPLASAIGWLAMLTLSYILLVASWFASLPIATLSVPEFSAAWVLVSYMLMFGVYLKVKVINGVGDWEVVEELEKAGAHGVEIQSSSAPAPQPDLPIFFR